MGTNFDALLPQCTHPCEHCEQPASIHIGKSMVMFQAHAWTPWGRINSWADWRDAIRKYSIDVIDEYGQTWDREEFIAAVESTGPEHRGRQFRWMVEHDLLDPERDWLDDDGFSITNVEFS